MSEAETKTEGASEKRNVDEAEAALEQVEDYLPTLLKRLSSHMTIPEGADVLDIGAAQGAYLTALMRLGYKARGVEIWEPAIATSKQLSERTGVVTDIVHGRAEKLPYEDNSFDLALAVSVMEHVEDPDQVFREVARVLRPGGGFYFFTGTALHPSGGAEIRRFPLFAWYPDAVRRRIMTWAITNRPHLVGGTEMPAFNWFLPWKVERSMTEAGFTKLVDIWDLKGDDELSGPKLKALELVRGHKPLKIAGYVAVGSLAYLAVK
jgi:SAM-dependent methyltransferase